MSQERACPKHYQVLSSNIKIYQAFYNILQGMSQERACPKNEPVPSIFEGMIGYDRACPKSGPVPNIYKHFITVAALTQHDTTTSSNTAVFSPWIRYQVGIMNLAMSFDCFSAYNNIIIVYHCCASHGLHMTTPWKYSTLVDGPP